MNTHFSSYKLYLPDSGANGDKVEPACEREDDPSLSEISEYFQGLIHLLYGLSLPSFTAYTAEELLKDRAAQLLTRQRSSELSISLLFVF
jgi:hypothetical protein